MLFFFIAEGALGIYAALYAWNSARNKRVLSAVGAGLLCVLCALAGAALLHGA